MRIISWKLNIRCYEPGSNPDDQHFNEVRTEFYPDLESIASRIDRSKNLMDMFGCLHQFEITPYEFSEAP